MIEGTLHPVPRWRDVVLEQIRIAGHSLRPVALVVAVVLGVGTAMVVGEILGGGPGFDSTEPYPTALFSFLFPFAVWRGERRFGPAFLWTLPVDRRRLALARVFAGWVWLMVALAVFASWLLALAFFARATPDYHVLRIPFVATVAAYLFSSAVVLGLRYPVRWLLGAAGVLMLMGRLSDVLHRDDDSEWEYVPGAQAFFSTVGDTLAAFRTLPDPAQWAITTFLLLGAGLLALWLAALRHRERRRH